MANDETLTRAGRIIEEAAEIIKDKHPELVRAEYESLAKELRETKAKLADAEKALRRAKTMTGHIKGSL